jgi:hypothetical protein
VSNRVNAVLQDRSPEFLQNFRRLRLGPGVAVDGLNFIIERHSSNQDRDTQTSGYLEAFLRNNQASDVIHLHLSNAQFGVTEAVSFLGRLLAVNDILHEHQMRGNAE